MCASRPRLPRKRPGQHVLGFEYFRLNFAARSRQRKQGGSIVADDRSGVGAADERALFVESDSDLT
jgi:hypothetical protein